MHKKFLVIFIILVLIFQSSSCTPGSTADKAPETDLEATIVALQAALAAAPTVAPTEAPPTPDMVATHVQATLDAMPPNQAPPTLLPPPTLTEVSDEADFEERMQSAKILLFEDMSGVQRVFQYVQETLEDMGVPFKDDGSARGWLKDDMLYGAEGGEPWDLIILANEQRAGISGEFFNYLENNMAQGTSVILEAWHLDSISEGAIKPLLSRCGVEISNYIGTTHSDIDLVLWPVASHTLLTEPNALSFKRPVQFHNWSDLGDYTELTGEGDAQILLGRKNDTPNRFGVLTVCLGGQLIMQTFSSHSYEREVMKEAWENYIRYALKVRFYGPQD